MNRTAEIIDQLANLNRINPVFQAGKVSKIAIEIRLSNDTATAVPVTVPTREALFAAVLDLAETLPVQDRQALAESADRFNAMLSAPPPFVPAVVTGGVA